MERSCWRENFFDWVIGRFEVVRIGVVFLFLRGREREVEFMACGKRVWELFFRGGRK